MTLEVSLSMTMEEILAKAPSAQRALFQRYHVGGCSSCGFEPSDTLEKVCKDHNLLDTRGVVQTIVNAHEVDAKMQVDPREVQGWIDAGEEFTFIDVRPSDERAVASLPHAEPLDFADQDRYMAMPRERMIVFLCGDGVRSLDVAAYFVGHGFQNVRTVRGGLAAWTEQVGPPASRA